MFPAQQDGPSMLSMDGPSAGWACDQVVFLVLPPSTPARITVENRRTTSPRSSASNLP